MTDIEAITDVLVRYATGIDSRDWQLFRTCFVEDSKLDYGGLGSWGSCEAVTRFMELAHSGPSMHRLSNFAISIDGDKATARTYVDAMVYGPGGIGGAHSMGYYDDELVRTGEGWQIRRRTYTSVTLKFLGIMCIIPAGLAYRLAVLGARKTLRRAANDAG